jgi:hypothetical protein
VIEHATLEKLQQRVRQDQLKTEVRLLCSQVLADYIKPIDFQAQKAHFIVQYGSN